MLQKNHDKKRVLVIGSGGMLGSAVFRFFAADQRFEAFGTIRSPGKIGHFTAEEHEKLFVNIDAASDDDLLSVFSAVRPDIVVNGVGVIKQDEAVRNQLKTLAVNAVLPHRLVQYCQLSGARLVHMSTDCVFSGDKGSYREEDFPDANDFYGRSKYLGEVDYPNAVTLRTSIIGHELESSKSLIDWFLSQSGRVKGYRKAIFSGFPTVEIARVIRDFVMPNEDLRGVYHLSAAPIDKFSLLSLVNDIYDLGIEIQPDSAVVIDRSLNSERFRGATGFCPDPWPTLIARMHQEYLRRGKALPSCP